MMRNAFVSHRLALAWPTVLRPRTEAARLLSALTLALAAHAALLWTWRGGDSPRSVLPPAPAIVHARLLVTPMVDAAAPAAAPVAPQPQSTQNTTPRIQRALPPPLPRQSAPVALATMSVQRASAALSHSAASAPAEHAVAPPDPPTPSPLTAAPTDPPEDTPVVAPPSGSVDAAAATPQALSAPAPVDTSASTDVAGAAAPGAMQPDTADMTARIELPSADAAYLNNPKPPYPPLSRRLGEQGTVILRVRIETDGTASSAEIETSSGYDRLDRVAQQTVLHWRYVPGTRGGIPEAMWFLIPIQFVLE